MSLSVNDPRHDGAMVPAPLGAPRNSIRFPQLRDAAWLTEHVVDKGLTAQQIADLLGCSLAAVINAKRTYSIGSPSRRREYPRLYPLLDDLAWLTSRVNEGWTYQRIADEVGCSMPLARVACREHNLLRGGVPVNRLLSDRSWVEARVAEGRNDADLGLLAGASGATAKKWRERHGIKRSSPRSLRDPRRFPQLSDRDWIAAQLETKTRAQLAYEVGCDPAAITRACSTLGIPRAQKNQRPGGRNVNATLTNDLYDWYAAEAHRQGTTISRLVRDALLTHYARSTSQLPPPAPVLGAHRIAS